MVIGGIVIGASPLAAWLLYASGSTVVTAILGGGAFALFLTLGFIVILRLITEM
jgi:hypothetical protein